MTRLSFVAVIGLLILPGCNRFGGGQKTTLVEARNGFKTQLVTVPRNQQQLPQPPAELFQVVRYDSSVGKLAAYLTPDPGDGKQHPAIIWIKNGVCNSINEGCWEKQPPEADRSGAQFREAGLVMMYPSLRGGNDNPGTEEGFFGEVDDILAAADYLAKRPWVDPARIYLGGYFTGGTMVLLVAECSDRFRAVFSFSPLDDIQGYPPEYTPFERDRKEIELRSPGLWLENIKIPVFVFAGASTSSDSHQRLARQSKNPNIRFLLVLEASGPSMLAPTNRLLAQKALADVGPACAITVTADEVNNAVNK